MRHGTARPVVLGMSVLRRLKHQIVDRKASLRLDVRKAKDVFTGHEIPAGFGDEEVVLIKSGGRRSAHVRTHRGGQIEHLALAQISGNLDTIDCDLIVFGIQKRYDVDL